MSERDVTHLNVTGGRMRIRIALEAKIDYSLQKLEL